MTVIIVSGNIMYICAFNKLRLLGTTNKRIFTGESVCYIYLSGKVMRRTLDKVSGMSATHLVSAWSVENNFCLGQVKVADKSNEITAIPVLLELLNIENFHVNAASNGFEGLSLQQKNTYDVLVLIILKSGLLSITYNRS